jgi:hypothetical protein
MCSSLEGDGFVTLEPHDKPLTEPARRAGKIRYGVAMWLLGLPLPIIIIALFWRGCDW